MTKRAVIVQCRLSSTRLPGKALKLLGNMPVLQWALNSMHKVPAERYFVATDEASYDSLKPVCEKAGFEIFKGDLNNVLKRFCDLIKLIDCDTVIRATADNPYLFYEAAIESLEDFEAKLEKGETVDYLTYSGLPHGSGVEIINAKSLLKAATETDLPYDKEHVGPALYNHKDKYVCEFVPAPEKYNFPQLRTTIDTITDFYRASRILHTLSEKNISSPFSTKDILEVLHSDYVKNPVVYIPSVKKGHGTGHLRRCVTAAIEGSDYIYIPENCSLAETSSIIKEAFNKGLYEWQVISSLPDDTYPSTIVTDLFSTEEAEFKTISPVHTVISLDEGSAYHNFADYLLDVIPSYNLNRKTNNTDSSLIEKPCNTKSETVKNYNKILVCVGGEDPAGLTRKSAEIIKSLCPEAEVIAIGTDEKNSSVKYVNSIPNLKEKIYEYDLVITHYGLTAFEAMYAGCDLLLLSTTKLHEHLAEKYNFAYIPFGKLTSDSFKFALKSKNIHPVSPLSNENKSLCSEIKNLSLGKKLGCPVCGTYSPEDVVVSRNITRTYRRCNTCKMTYIAWTSIQDRVYEKSYFFDEYKKQYGKTYEEDFEYIKKNGISRINNIKNLMNVNNKTVLDIGCAYGPFLSAAKDSGFIPYGTDISSDAVEYVNSKLNFKAVTGAFPDFDSKQLLNIEKFDCCTMWYVIEHFKDLDSVLKKVNSLINKNGVFAFSTPSGQGVSAASDVHHFYEISPTDHYSVWDFKSAKSVLKKYGFKIERIVSTGHHPERFPFIKKHESEKGSALWNYIDFYSHLAKKGDTMEIYCRKIRDVE